MKIENSHVNMASSHNSYTHVEVAKIERRASADTLGTIMQPSEGLNDLVSPELPQNIIDFESTKKKKA